MNARKLSSCMEDFLTLKRTMAEADPHYSRVDRNQLNHRDRLLRAFFAFWRKQGCPWPVRAQLALDWVGEGSDGQHPYRDLVRLQVVQAFLRQVRVFEPETEIPENIFRTGCGRRTPHIFSNQEILRLTGAARQNRLRHTLCPLTLCTLVGLLASTGLRVGEAIRLKVGDARLAANPPHLLIYETKFGKSRQVVLHASTAVRLRSYHMEREKAFPCRAEESFFVNRSGRPLEYNSLFASFQKLLKRAGIQPIPGKRAPSFHSFRHTFAVNRLTQWHREGRDVQDLLTHLAVYLGHVGPENTYWYVTATPELLNTAAARFTPPRLKGAARL
jgi:integrase/recombinase XerD